MSVLLILIVVSMLVIIFSQFGGALSATSAWYWWLVGLFLLVATVQPEIYRPLADILGIKFISNFVLAALVMFLFVQVLSSQAASVHMARRYRQFVSSEAISRYLHQNQHVQQPRILIVLPTFNEEDNIDAVAASLRTHFGNKIDFHYCFINDGSTDQSARKLSLLGPQYHCEHLSNINVSGVLLSGFKLAESLGATYVVQCDSDGQHPVSEISRLVMDAESTGVDCLVGSRYLRDGLAGRIQNGSTSVFRAMGSKSLCMALKFLFGLKITDPTSGFRVYSRAAVKVLSQHLPDEYPEPESLAILAIHGLKIAETSVVMNARAAGVSSISGLKSFGYMSKVISALLGLRIRSLIS